MGDGVSVALYMHVVVHVSYGRSNAKFKQQVYFFGLKL